MKEFNCFSQALDYLVSNKSANGPNLFMWVMYGKPANVVGQHPIVITSIKETVEGGTLVVAY